MKLLYRLAIASASLTIGLAAVGTQTASTAIVNYSFTVESKKGTKKRRD